MIVRTAMAVAVVVTTIGVAITGTESADALRTEDRCFKRHSTHAGDSSPNVILGTVGNDVMRGGDGGDSLFGLSGRDRLCGGSGDDELVGGDGFDRINGGPGSDHCTGEIVRRCEG